MPTSGKAPDVLLDASVAVALTVADHEDHEATMRRLAGRLLGLSGHAVFETFSVLTRLPPPARRSPATVAKLMVENFPANRFLSVRQAADLLACLSSASMWRCSTSNRAQQPEQEGPAAPTATYCTVRHDPQ